MKAQPKTWLVLFRDDPQMLEHRKSFGAQHLEYVSAHRDQIRLAGGTRFAEEAPFIGGAWVVLADDQAEVRALVENDPYYHPVHRKFDINYWGLVFDQMNEALSPQ